MYPNGPAPAQMPLSNINPFTGAQSTSSIVGTPLQTISNNQLGSANNQQTRPQVPINNVATQTPQQQAPSGSTDLGGTTLNAPAYIAGIQQEYGGQLNAGPQNEAILQQGQQGQVNAQNTNTQASENLFNQQANAQTNTLRGGINQQQNQQQLSLAELADQIRGQNQGLQAQLGAVGAGNSSAAGAGQQALAHEQNIQRANIDQQGTTNISNAQNQIQGVNQVLGANMTQLETAKQNNINNITNNYSSLMKQLQVALTTASGEEQARLAEFGQSLTSAATTALQNLTGLNGSIQNNVTGLLNAGNQNATTQAIPQAQSLSPIVTQPVSPFTNNTQPGNAQGNASAVPGGMTLSDLLNQPQQAQPTQATS